MDYTLSVYKPEIAINDQPEKSKDELFQKIGVTKDGDAPLLVQLLRSNRNKEGVSSAPQPSGSKQEKKSPFGNKPEQNARAQQFSNNQAMGSHDDIEEDIVQDHEDINLESKSARMDVIEASGNSASKSCMGIDQSIDTLNLENYDYVEDVKITPRAQH